MEKMTSWASFIHKDVLEKKKSYKSQTGEIVPVLTGTDLLPSPQGHKVSLLMHAVKGNLANTVCKRKHQHIASVPVLGGPCMLFSNFDSFLWGQGVWVMDFFFPPPTQCHPDPKPRGGNLNDRDVCFLAHKTKPNPCARQWGLPSGQMCTHTFSCTVIYSTWHPDSFCEKTDPQIFQWIWSFSILAQTHTHTHYAQGYGLGAWGGGQAGPFGG